MVSKTLDLWRAIGHAIDEGFHKIVPAERASQDVQRTLKELVEDIESEVDQRDEATETLRKARHKRR